MQSLTTLIIRMLRLMLCSLMQPLLRRLSRRRQRRRQENYLTINSESRSRGSKCTRHDVQQQPRHEVQGEEGEHQGRGAAAAASGTVIPRQRLQQEQEHQEQEDRARHSRHRFVVVTPTARHRVMHRLRVTRAACGPQIVVPRVVGLVTTPARIPHHLQDSLFTISNSSWIRDSISYFYVWIK